MRRCLLHFSLPHSVCRTQRIFYMLSLAGVNTEMFFFKLFAWESVLFSNKQMTVYICWMPKLLIANYSIVWLPSGVNVRMIISMSEMGTFTQ